MQNGRGSEHRGKGEMWREWLGDKGDEAEGVKESIIDVMRMEG